MSTDPDGYARWDLGKSDFTFTLPRHPEAITELAQAAFDADVRSLSDSWINELASRIGALLDAVQDLPETPLLHLTTPMPPGANRRQH